MRILFVTPYLPSRIRVRSFHFIQALSRWHDISLVCLICDEYERDLLPEIQPYCLSIDYVLLSRAGAYARCLQSLPTSTPLRVAYYQSPAFARLIVQVARRQASEVLHGELVKIVPALLAVRAETHLPCLYDAVDCMSSLLTQQRRETLPWKKPFLALELAKLRSYEPAMFTRFEQVVITTSNDKMCLQSLDSSSYYRRPIQVIANGIDTAHFSPGDSPREKDLLVFCAKLDYFPNVQAILVFCRDVMPLLWRRRPGLRLEIVGCNPPKVVQALEVEPRIKVVGQVPDMRPYLARASVAVAPLKVAAGMQNKILEALAMETPLVATPLTCQPLAVRDGRELLLAEEPQEWVDRILRILEYPSFAKELGRAGRTYVLSQTGWQQSAQCLSEIYTTLRSEASRQQVVR